VGNVADLAAELTRQQHLHERERTRRQAAEHTLRLILAHPADAEALARGHLEEWGA